MANEKNGAVLVIAPLMDRLMQALVAQYEVITLYDADDADAVLRARGSEIQVIVTRGDIGVSTTVLEKISAPGLIAVFGVGTDAIDLDYTRRRNIAVSITSGVLTDDVADMAMLLMLAASRKLLQGHALVQQGRWPDHAPALSRKVSGKRIGIVGMGNIGQAIARRADAFAMTVSYYSRTAKPALPYRYYPHLTDLARDSDFLVIAAAGGSETRHIIDEAIFTALPPHAWLVNVARGSLVDEAALIDALTRQQIAGAALDVFANEPEVNPALRQRDNVVLQPHVGSATGETREQMSECVLNNIAAFFQGVPLPNALT